MAGLSRAVAERDRLRADLRELEAHPEPPVDLESPVDLEPPASAVVDLEPPFDPDRSATAISFPRAA